MKLIIDIPEDVYTRLFDNEIALDDVCEMARALRLGIPHETVTEFADRCRECGREKVLNKIRAEIKALSNANPSYWHSGDMVEREEVFDIIDKYKTESEE